jgi:hypothetical protein
MENRNSGLKKAGKGNSRFLIRILLENPENFELLLKMQGGGSIAVWCPYYTWTTPIATLAAQY